MNPTPEQPPGGATRSRLLVLAALVAVSMLRWHSALLEDFVKPDEHVYVSAARLWSEGRSPYEEDIYFYPPVFAAISSSLVERFGVLGYLKIQRTLNLLGISIATWLALLVVRWRAWPSLAVGAGWLCLAPSVALPVTIGNATGLSAALTLASLWIWQRSSSLSGAALGLGQALKPIAPLAPFCLLATRGPEPKGARRAGAVAILTGAALLLVGWRHLPGLLENASGSLQPYNFSLQSILAGFGLDLRPIWILMALGLAGLWWIRRRALSRRELLVVTVTLNLVAAPILWAHSLLLFFPVQLLAAEQLVRSWRAGPTRTVLTRSATVLAGLALLSTIFSASVGGLAGAAPWIQSLVKLVPYLSLAYLAGYALPGLGSVPSQPG